LENGHLEDLEGDGRITLIWILERWVMDITNSGSCSVLDIGITVAEPMGSVASKLVILCYILTGVSGC
jgi:hypothetical protein